MGPWQGRGQSRRSAVFVATEAKDRAEKLAASGARCEADELLAIVESAEAAVKLMPEKITKTPWKSLKECAIKVEDNGNTLPDHTRQALTKKYAIESFLDGNFAEWAAAVWLAPETADEGDTADDLEEWNIEAPRMHMIADSPHEEGKESLQETGRALHIFILNTRDILLRVLPEPAAPGYRGQRSF